MSDDFDFLGVEWSVSGERCADEAGNLMYRIVTDSSPPRYVCDIYELMLADHIVYIHNRNLDRLRVIAKLRERQPLTAALEAAFNQEAFRQIMLDAEQRTRQLLREELDRWFHGSSKDAEAVQKAADGNLVQLAEWKPIETAPKDGTNILLFNEHGACLPTDQYVGYWNPDREEWFDHSNEYGYDATHWMPLPAPPKKAEQ